MTLVNGSPRELLKTSSPLGEVSLLLGSIDFALQLVKAGEYDKYLPPYQPDAVFLSVVHSETTTVEMARAVAVSVLFEVSNAANLDFRVAAIPSMDEHWRKVDAYQADGDEALQAHLTSIPLESRMLDDGLAPVVETFMEASGALTDGHAIFCYVKALEFVGATVQRQDAHGRLRRRLASARVLAPDAAYLDGLLALAEKAARVRTSDKHMLELTIVTCADAVLLAPLAPQHTRALRQLAKDATEKDTKKALQELAACATATRNMVVHAKTNYVASGSECPSHQLGQLRLCLRECSVQAIRWLARVKPESRVL